MTQTFDKSSIKTSDKTVDPALSELRRLIRYDIRASEALTDRQIRYLVDVYYSIQEERIRAAAQIRSVLDPVTKKPVEPVDLLDRVFAIQKTLEEEIKHALHGYCLGSEHGSWSLTILGVGPVLAAGLQAHIDLDIATNPSKIWRFAGLDPTSQWNRGEKRPWNAKLKVICWKLGESFTKVSNLRPGEEISLYGRLYKERKQLEVERNNSGANAELAAKELASGKFQRDTTAKKAYEAGKLPDGRLQLRAQRYAVKKFLAHWWAVGWEINHPGEKAPNPWIIQHGGHTDQLAIPNW